VNEGVTLQRMLTRQRRHCLFSIPGYFLLDALALTKESIFGEADQAF
jgi:hypothetical protein